MIIHGLQKLTLLDFPEHTACTVFLAGCNFRCPFCHNSELLNAATADPLMDDVELLGLEKGEVVGVAGYEAVGKVDLSKPYRFNGAEC